MKKGTGVTSKSVSTPTCAMKIRTTEPPRGQHNSNSLTTLLNRKTRSSQELESSKSCKPARITVRRAKMSPEKKPNLKESLSRFKVEDMTPRELHESLDRFKENPVEPFTFLNNILDERTSGHVPIERTKPTEIDLQLAALKRRVQLNQSLLERTNEHVKEINFLVEKNTMMASRELNYDENESEQKTATDDAAVDGDSALKTSCPGIMELQRTIEATKDMLGYVRKICNEEMLMSDLPKELADKFNSNAEEKKGKN